MIFVIRPRPFGDRFLGDEILEFRLKKKLFLKGSSSLMVTMVRYSLRMIKV